MPKSAKRRPITPSGRRPKLFLSTANPLLQSLPATHLAKFLAAHPALEFPAQHIFFQPSLAGHSLFLLEKGHVKTYRTAGNKKLIISELDPPGVFGEMGCLGPCIYHCYAATTEASLVRVIPKPQVDTLLHSYPQVSRYLLDLVSRRFIKLLLDLDSSSFRHLIPRLAALLLARAEGDEVCNTTHQFLADHLRVYRESVTAALGELRRAGIIALSRKQIHILDRARLQRASHESK
jgi:CRP/FNR family transcriptional regulator, cyclic AMP receptor protein